jgi:hypothetical protein
MTRLASALVNMAILAVSLTLSLIAAEAATRWYYRDVTTSADFHGYFTRRWLRTEVRHNHYGFRGPEFDEIKPAGIYRVAVLGDSFTYGNGIAEEDRFSDRLAAALGERRIQVLNFGFPGNNWPDHVATLERRVLRLKPDFVLLQWDTNDVEVDIEGVSRPTVRPLAVSRALHEWLYDRSALYAIFNVRWTRFALGRQLGNSYGDYMWRVYGDSGSAASRAADEWSHRFFEDCSREHVPVAVVLFPQFGETLEDYPLAFLHARMRQTCEQAHVRCLDLLDRFREVPDTKTLWASPLDQHPNALANRIAADAILAGLAPDWGFDEAARR